MIGLRRRGAAMVRSEFEGLLASFPRHSLALERYSPANLRVLPERWLRPFGWHLLAFCRKAD